MLDLKRTSWNFCFGPQLTYGPNAVQTLAKVIERHAFKRVFLIADENLVEANVVAQAEKAIGQTSAQLQVFTDGEVEPSTETVERVVIIAREFQPDVFVAVGGGSNMDLTKACSAVVRNDCTAESLLGFDNVPGPMAKLVCIPTTAGTGSEVSHAAVLKNSNTGEKSAALSRHLRPDFAIVDPYMTISCPANVTAESGMDALTHAIEAYLVSNFFVFEELMGGDLAFEGNHPFGDMFAEKAIQLIAQHLTKAVEEPENLSARSGMSLAATMAGLAFSSCGVGLCHALEHSISSASKQCSHGAGNGIVLPEVLRFLAEHRPKKVAKVAACLNTDFAAMPNDEAADAAIDFICRLRDSINLPKSLTAVGIDESKLPAMASSAIALQQLIDLTPGSPTEADALRILKACL